MRPFVPQPLPRDDLDWGELVPLIARANRAIARYDGIVQGLVTPSVLLSPLAAREAVLSSMIEGTQTTLEELLEFEADPHLIEIVDTPPAEVPRRVEPTVRTLDVANHS